jgi:hypothetical protein
MAEEMAAAREDTPSVSSTTASSRAASRATSSDPAAIDTST